MAHDEDRKYALIAQLTAQRARLSREAERVKDSANVSARLKSSFAGNRISWLAGAAVAGLSLSWLRPRTKTVKIRTGAKPEKAAFGVALLMPAAKFVFDLARPALVSMLTARVANFAGGRPAPPRGNVR